MIPLPTELNTQRAKSVTEPWESSPHLTDHLRTTGYNGRVFVSVRGQEVAMSRCEAMAHVDEVCAAIKEAGA